jgi:RNA polymerase sigma-70 factor (ECF subfamily)
MEPILSDAELAPVVARAKAGDDAALDDLCRRCYSVAYDFLAYLIPAEAEDLTQELFADLRKRLRGYEETGRFTPWLRSVAFNLFRTRNRSNQRRREEPLDPDEYDIALAEATSTIFTTEKRALRVAVGRLPETLREAWTLYAEGHEPQEIARKLAITPGAAATRVSRAKIHLERILTEPSREEPR